MAVFKTNEPTKDGRAWYFSTYFVDLYGVNKKYKSKKYLLKKDAQDAERLFLLRCKEQDNNTNLTFKDLILDYNKFQKDKVKITTYKNYAKFNKKMESLNKVKLDHFNISHFNLWKDKLKKEKLSTVYKNNTYKYLRALINYAIKYYNQNNLINILNKMTGFDNPNEIKKEMKFFTHDEFLKFIEHEKDLKYKCFFEILYYCGLRKGEANALTWKDINLENAAVNINKNITLKIKGEKYLLLTPKTKSSNRILPLPEILLNDLKTHKNNAMQFKDYSDKWFVFGFVNPLPDTTIQKHNIDNTKNAGFKEHIRIHDFRHSCASLLISNGASITLVAKYLGHSNIATTLNTYTHLFKNEFDDIIKVINNL